MLANVEDPGFLVGWQKFFSGYIEVKMKNASKWLVAGRVAGMMQGGKMLRDACAYRCLVDLPVSTRTTVDPYCMLEVNAMPFLNKRHTAEEYSTPPNLRALPPVPLLFVSV